MSASDEQVARVKRLCSIEAGDTTYTDEVVAEYIERHPLMDEDGYEPDDTLWTPTYDTYLAASDICEEKAAALSGNFDFSADGGSYTRSQEFEHWSRLSSRYRSRRAITSVSLQSSRPYVLRVDEEDDEGTSTEDIGSGS